MTQESSNKHSTEQTTEQKEQTQKPKGLLRPIGLGLFLVFFVALPASAYFFASSLFKFGIETSMESVFGAQTDIQEVNVTWQPFGIEVLGIAQTDPNNAMSNLVQVDYISAKMDVFELLLGNVIIDELAATGVQANHARNNAGEIFVSTTKADVAEDATETSPEKADETENDALALPDAKQALADADLITEQKATALSQVIDTENKKLDEALRALPNDKSLNRYQKDWNSLTSTSIKSLDDIKSLQAKLDELSKRIQQDKTALAAAKKQYKDSKAAIDLAIKELKSAPSKDWQSIKAKYPIDNPNAVSISKVLFGDKAGDYIQQAQDIYQQVKPYIDAYKEVKAEQKIEAEPMLTSKKVSFELDEPLPKILIRSLTLSFSHQNDNYVLSGNEFTHQHYVRNQASEFQVMLDGDNTMQFILNGEFYIDAESHFTSKGAWQSDQPQIGQSNIASDGEINVDLEAAHIIGNGSFNYDKELTSTNKLEFRDVKFGGQGGTELADITLEALKNVTQFDANFAVSGTIDNPNLTLNSNLDKYLSAGFEKALKKRWQAFEKEVKADLAARLKQNLNLKDGDLEKLENWQAELKNIEDKLKKYGQDEIDNVVAKAKNKYEKELKQKAEAKIAAEKKKLEDKLKKEQEKLELEKKKAKEKAAAEKKKAEEKLKDKLKDKIKDFKCCE